MGKKKSTPKGRGGFRLGSGRPRKYQPGEAERVSLLVPHRVLSQIDATAKREGATRTAVILRLLREATRS